MAAIEPPPLILFSGLAADANVFVPQTIAFPHLLVPKWPTALPSDTLDSYCKRIAESLQSHGGMIIGGASFGGIIALHVAQHLNPAAVLLIGSVRSPAELSQIAKLCRPLKSLVSLIPVRFLQLCVRPLASRIAKRSFPHLCGAARQFRASDPAVFRWSLAQLLAWDSTPTVQCPVLQIHGDRDYVLPIRHTHPDTVVIGGGHVLSLTHPRDVNDFIASAISESAGEACGPGNHVAS